MEEEKSSGAYHPRFTFSKLNHLKLNKSSKSTRPQKVNHEHKFNLDVERTSSIVVMEEKKAKKTWKDKLIIRPDNKYKQAFDIWIGILVAYSCTVSVYYASFEEPTRTQQIVDLSLESFFWIDILLNFFILCF